MAFVAIINPLNFFSFSFLISTLNQFENHVEHTFKEEVKTQSKRTLKQKKQYEIIIWNDEQENCPENWIVKSTA